jgi:hypothetical protein
MARTNTNPQNNQPWLVPDVFFVPGALHDMPKHPEKFLPKFDPDSKYFSSNHIKNFMLAVRLMNVRHEDVVCKLFPYTFENKA